MNFLYPLGAVFFASLPVILGLYILRLKRREVKVSTTLFWRQVLEDVEANTPFQKLRYSHLLLLQLLIATVLVLALMNPAIVYPATAGLDTVLVVDASASMGATDGSPTRLEAAKEQLRALIADKGRRDRLAIVVAGREARVGSDLTADSRLLLAAIEDLEPEPVAAAMPQALDLALQLVGQTQQRDTEALPGQQEEVAPGTAGADETPEGGPPQAQIVVFTDDPGGVGEPPESATPVRWAVQPVGFSDAQNAAILTAALTEPDLARGTMALFLTTTFKGPTDALAELTVHQGKDLLDIRQLALRAGTEESHVFDGVPLRPGRYALDLKLLGPAPLEDGTDSGETLVDQLEIDNHAYLVYEPQELFTILVLSSRSVYGTVLALLPEVKVYQRALSGGIPSGDFDLILVDGDLPLNAPPANYLVVHSNNHDLLPVSVVGEEVSPVLSDWKATDPLLRFVNPQTFRINTMMSAEPKEWGRVVLDTTKGPAIVYGEQGQNRVVYWAFDPFTTELPTRATFPFLLSAHVEFFKSRRGQQTLTTQDQIRLAVGTGAMSVTSPDGERMDLSGAPGEEQTVEPTALGFWQANLDTAQGVVTHDYGVNLFDARESLLPASDTFAGESGIGKFEQTKRGAHPQWRYLALAVLLFLLGEWYVYHQRLL